MRCVVCLSLTLIMITAFLAENVCGEKKEFFASVSADGIQKVEVLAREYFLTQITSSLQ